MVDNIIDKNTNISLDADDPKNPTPTTVIANCQLQVALGLENIAVYVCKGAKQCFNFTALSCCGSENISIVYDGQITPQLINGEVVIIVPNFGTFITNVSGICFRPDDKLGTDAFPTETFLNFKASGCGVKDFPLTVNFVYDPCKCCCKCRRGK